jgi:hypothetical protein
MQLIKTAVITKQRGMEITPLADTVMHAPAIDELSLGAPPPAYVHRRTPPCRSQQR